MFKKELQLRIYLCGPGIQRILHQLLDGRGEVNHDLEERGEEAGGEGGKVRGRKKAKGGEGLPVLKRTHPPQKRTCPEQIRATEERSMALISGAARWCWWCGCAPSPSPPFPPCCSSSSVSPAAMPAVSAGVMTSSSTSAAEASMVLSWGWGWGRGVSVFCGRGRGRRLASPAARSLLFGDVRQSSCCLLLDGSKAAPKPKEFGACPWVSPRSTGRVGWEVGGRKTQEGRGDTKKIITTREYSRYEYSSLAKLFVSNRTFFLNVMRLS